MPTLHVFGCSMASGYTFSGTDQPEKSFGRYCANELGMSYKIHAENSVSNLYIYDRLVANLDDITDKDIVVIMWTYPNRTCVIKDEYTHIMASQFYATDNKETQSYYTDIYSDARCKLETTSLVLAANKLLESKKVPVINSTHWFTQCRGQAWFFDHAMLSSCGIQFPECMLYKFITNSEDKSFSDGYHPSENATKDYGKRLANYIRDKYEQD